MDNDNKMIHGVIYMYLNKINNKIYIGQTIHERRRYLSHRSFSNLGTHPEIYIDKAIHKYGFSNFDYGVMADVYDPDKKVVEHELNELEKMYIEFYNTTDKKFGYNITKGGNGKLGYKVSKETKEKISKMKKGKKFSAKAIKGMKKAREKQYIKVAMYSREGKFIREFKSTLEASTTTGIHNGNICNCMNGKRPTAGGYVFKKVA
jgi:hypothetical protein